MKLYHASQYKFDKIERRQASHPNQKEFDVPDNELQNKIYFSPDFGFALAMAAGPDGMTSLRNGQISFEHDDEFNPELKVFIYEIDSENIPPELMDEVDHEQIAIDLDEIVPDAVHEMRAEQVFEYYERTQWKRPDEFNQETKFN